LPLIIPNLLSAYGNSTWQIGNLPPKTEVMLYNALGQLVFRSENYANELTAAQLAAGMYFYEISPPQREEQKGKLVVIR
ncbi:MAG: gliding motility-associated C-terminal domain-containing protein, partial [Bacteroidetes bacterium]|nr:gliding motility-associated C-terminal domain-containing protein [Bacteroidota bacterium]